MPASGHRALRRELVALVGEDAVQLPIEDLTLLRDATETRGLSGAALAAVFPQTPAQVAAVVAWAQARQVPFVARGGGTGYAGGAIPDAGSLIIATNRLRAIREVNPASWLMTVEAGLTTAEVQRLARESGLWLAPNPGAAEQSLIGGNVATNAGGPRSLRFGSMRAWIGGLEVVLPDGTLLRTGGRTRKNVETLDLTGLLCGSEGTLGVITAVTLRLQPRPEVIAPRVALYASREDGLVALQAVMACGCVPAALEFLDAGALAAGAGSFPAELPPSARFLVLAESCGPHSVVDAELAILTEALHPGALAIHAPHERAAAQRLIAWRDGVSLAVVAQHGGKLSEDVVVPFDRLAEALAMIDAVGAEHGLPVTSWGHAGDGNLHATVLVDRASEPDLRRAERAAAALLEIPFALGGALSGEHGIGLVKRAAAARLPAELLDAQAAVARALDPHDLANPGRKLPVR